MKSRILNVPYRTQHGLDAVLRNNDSGATCIAMVLDALGQHVAIDALPTLNNESEQGADCGGIVDVMHDLGLKAVVQTDCTLDNLKSLIDKGLPPIALIKYDKIVYRWDREKTGGHHVVVVGYDDANQRVIVNDPDYPPGAMGYQRPYSYKVFMNAWGGFDSSLQPRNCLVIPKLPNPIGGGAPLAKSADRSSWTISHDAWVIEPHRLALRATGDSSAEEIGTLIYGQHAMALGHESPPDRNDCIWQFVESDLGLIGAVCVSCGGERNLTSMLPPEPHLIQALNTQAVRDAQGLSLRPKRNIFVAPIDRAQVGERLIAYSRIVESNGEVWLSVQSARATFGWVRENIDGYSLVEVIDKWRQDRTVRDPRTKSRGSSRLPDRVGNRERPILLPTNSVHAVWAGS